MITLALLFGIIYDCYGKKFLGSDFVLSASIAMFCIFGATTQTNYIDNTINCSIGQLKDNRLMCGPLESVKKHCEKYITFEQGNSKTSEIAKKIKKEFSYPDLDDIIRILPTGNIDIKKERKKKK